MDNTENPAHAIVDDILSSVGLVLNVAAVITSALWLSLIGGTHGGGSAAIAGIGAIVFFAASFVCFALNRGEDASEAAPAVPIPAAAA